MTSRLTIRQCGVRRPGTPRSAICLPAPGRPTRSWTDGRARRMTADGDDLERLAAELRDIAPSLPQRLDASAEDIDAGLARLVLTLIEFLRQVLEHQAVRRMEGGGLSDEEIERIGVALMRL